MSDWFECVLDKDLETERIISLRKLSVETEGLKTRIVLEAQRGVTVAFVKVHAIRQEGRLGVYAWTFSAAHCDELGKALRDVTDTPKVLLDNLSKWQVIINTLSAEDIQACFDHGVAVVSERVLNWIENETRIANVLGE